LASPSHTNPEIAELFRVHLQPHFDAPEIDEESPRLFYGLYDHIVVGYAISPDLFATTVMNVDVNTTHGPEYGASYGYVRGSYHSGLDQWPLDDGSQIAKIVYDVELEAFVELYVSTLTE
jgi:inosine-uridine nucleoside N-ribohydrolase